MQNRLKAALQKTMEVSSKIAETAAPIFRKGQNLVGATNDVLENFTPLELISATGGLYYLSQNPVVDTTTLTIAATALTYGANKAYQNWDTRKISKFLYNKAIGAASYLPVVGKKIDDFADLEMGKNTSAIKIKSDEERKAFGPPIAELPETGWDRKRILDRFKLLQAKYKDREGQISGAVYTEFEPEDLELFKEIYGLTALTNPMHNEWPLIKAMYAEIISMMQNLLHGKSGAHGVITHGGTTSIIEACLAYVMHAKANGIKHPELIVPETAHVAFDKAAELLGVKIHKIPVGPDGKVDVAKMAAKINRNTCMLVGSAPSFPNGIADDIEKIAALGLERGISVHVDSCLGGFLTANANKEKHPLPPFDFSIPGVTSISIDTHKHGEAPKGTSVLLFSPDCKATPTQAYLDWVGGMYATDTMDGSRSGSDIAVLWAALMRRGKDYYEQSANDILDLKDELVKVVNSTPGVQVAYDPKLCVVGIRPKDIIEIDQETGKQTIFKINPLIVAEQLEHRGFGVSLLQTANQKPDGFHFCLTKMHVKKKDFLEKFSKALHESVQFSKENPQAKPSGLAKIYGALPIIPEFLRKRLADAYIKIQNTIPGVDIPGIWKQPPETNANDNKGKEKMEDMEFGQSQHLKVN